MPNEKPATLSLDRYAPDARGWIVSAQALADDRKHAEITPLHLLSRGLVHHPGIPEALRRAGANVLEMSAAVERALMAAPRGDGQAFLSARVLDLFGRAEREADRERAREVGIEHLLGALTQEVRGPAGEILGAFGIGPGSLGPHLGVLRSTPRHAPLPGTADAGAPMTRDLVQAAREKPGDPVIGRDTELLRLLTILERHEKCNPLLVGEPGVGKFAIVRALARSLAAGAVPSSLAGARLLEMDVGALAAGARLRSDMESRARSLVESVEGGEGDPILVVRGIEQLFGQPGTGSPVLDALRPVLDRGALRVLGTTSAEGLRRMTERDPALTRSFTVLEVEEPSAERAVEILRGIAGRFEEHHRVRIESAAVVLAVSLAKRYLRDRLLPDGAIDLLDESASSLRVEAELGRLKAGGKAAPGPGEPESGGAAPGEEIAVLGEQHVAATLERWTGIPVARMLEGEADKLLCMEERLEQRVVGQSEGVRALARAVRRGRVGLRDLRRPIGSFLFLGPSGVGKTELAKALAEFLFDDEAALTRLDMSEFMERHMAQRLIGAPPGYADSDQGGFLTEAVRKRPYSVLLFDEVEKAHQDVFNLLLQVLDDGRLTDGRGRLADFTNTVVIMTSNIGSDRILEAEPRLFDSPEGREALRDVLLDQLGKFFRPEFLNRIDDVIVFRPLAREHLARIVDIQLDQIRALLAPRRVLLEVDAGAKARLVELGYHPALGARPLRRAILKSVQDPLAEKLLEKGLAEGTTLRLRLEGEALVFVAEPPAG
jgi:ATP-dependent Clp protease ATP-binding subunit ClpC